MATARRYARRHTPSALRSGPTSAREQIPRGFRGVVLSVSARRTSEPTSFRSQRSLASIKTQSMRRSVSQPSLGLVL